MLRRTAVLASLAALGLGIMPAAAETTPVSDPVLTPPTSDVVGPPSDPACLPLGAGTTGVLLVGGQVPSPDQVAGEPGGLGEPVTGDLGRRLPDRIVFRDGRNTYSNEYAFALRGGRIYVRLAEQGVGREGEPWRRLELPACLDGRVQEVSADHRLLVALGPERQVYSHDMPGGDLSAERWTWRWGPYFWTGSGMRMWDDVQEWAASEFTSAEWFRDTAGRRHHPIGVATVYLLRGDGRRITYLDPWLPQDESREVCGPRRGTLPLAGLSGSGSVAFVAGEQGQLYTRLYDFDVSGANTVFGDYTWERVPADDPRWQLPGPRWVRQPTPPGRVTDRISIAKTGVDATDRVLRVEGRDRSGRTGYWEKGLTAARWAFVRTGEPLRGELLPSPTRGSRLLAPDDRRYVGEVGERRAVLRDFNPECSPARLTVQVTPQHRLDLVLHSSDGLRQERRERGLTDVPREYNGAIQVPRATWRHLDDQPEAVRRWVATHLDGRVTTAPIAVTATRLRFLAQCWQLTLDGKPARPDQAALPPDAGAVVGRLTEMQKDGREPSVCPS